MAASTLTNMENMYGTIVSTIALAMSLLTAWLTLLQRGRVRMTQPTMLAFVQDGKGSKHKVVIRALLYSTAVKGNIVENMFAVLHHRDRTTSFASWYYGESKENQRGGGIFVGREGIALYHHFVLLAPDDLFVYETGPYTVEIFAKVLGKRSGLGKLATAQVEITDSWAGKLNEKSSGPFFNLNPLTGRYEVDDP